MEREIPAICAGCGRTIEHGVAPDRSGLCERCAEAASIRPGNRDRRNPEESSAETQESARDAVIERLRERYHEARALVATGESDPTHRGQLDWIFGAHGDDVRREAPLDVRTSELVVLWLEDLIRHLEEHADAGGAARPGHHAARGLHDATREFADAFLRRADAACGS